MYAAPIIEKLWMFMMRMPRTAIPRSTSIEIIRSDGVTGITFAFTLFTLIALVLVF